MKKFINVITFALSALLTVALISACNKTEPSTIESLESTLSEATDVAIVTEEPDETIPEGYIDGDVDYFEDVPAEWCNDFDVVGANDNFNYEVKGMYVKKYFLGVKFIEPVIILKITNISSEVREWDLDQIRVDVNAKPTGFSRVCDVQPGETIYRYISIPVDTNVGVVNDNVCTYTINNILLRFTDLDLTIDFTNIEQPEV